MALFNKTRNGKETDIFHSADYLSMSYKDRERLAFSKENSAVKSQLTEADKLRMQGYAQAKSEQSKAYAFKNSKKKKK